MSCVKLLLYKYIHHTFHMRYSMYVLRAITTRDLCVHECQFHEDSWFVNISCLDILKTHELGEFSIYPITDVIDHREWPSLSWPTCLMNKSLLPSLITPEGKDIILTFPPPKVCLRYPVCYVRGWYKDQWYNVFSNKSGVCKLWPPAHRNYLLYPFISNLPQQTWKLTQKRMLSNTSKMFMP